MRRMRARIFPAMVDRAARAGIAAMCGVCVLASGIDASACPVVAGQRVVLASQELDPDVFVWDTRDRLIRYALGQYDVQMVLHHTILVRAYSRAVVVTCRDAALKPPFANESDPGADLIAVRVMSGEMRGHYGWVLSTDVRRPNGTQLSGR
jgi:hypothetical protein